MSLDPRARHLLPFAAAIFAGVLQVLVFPEASLSWLAPVCLVPLLTTLESATARQRFLLGWASGVAVWGRGVLLDLPRDARLR